MDVWWVDRRKNGWNNTTDILWYGLNDRLMHGIIDWKTMDSRKGKEEEEEKYQQQKNSRLYSSFSGNTKWEQQTHQWSSEEQVSRLWNSLGNISRVTWLSVENTDLSGQQENPGFLLIGQGGDSQPAVSKRGVEEEQIQHPVTPPTSVTDDWSPWLVDLVTRRAANSFLSLR